MDLYQILEVSKNASLEEIKKSYRRLARKYHPDRNPGDEEATEKFKEVQEAYDALSDPAKRAEYDRFGTVGRRPPMSASKSKASSQPRHHSGFASNIWEEFFGGTPDKGRSVQVRVELTLEEAYTGVTKPIKIQQRGRCDTCEGKGYTEWEPCNTCSGSGRAFFKQAPFNIFVSCTACRGTGRAGTNKCPDCLGTSFKPVGEKTLDVEIPAGIETGMQIRLVGEGEPGRNGARHGDVFVVIVVKEHKVFKREGPNLYLDLPMSYTQFVFGSEFSMPHISGTKVVLQIPRGTQSGTRFRMKNLGMPNMKGGRGDLIVTTKLEVPESFGDEYGKVLQTLKEFEEKNVTPMRKAFASAVGNNS